MLATAPHFDRLIELYGGDLIIIESIAAINVAIRAQKMNQGQEIFPISSTYQKFEGILKENRLTLGDLAFERDKRLKDLIKT